MKANSRKHTNSIYTRITKRVLCKLNYISFIVLLSLLEGSKGYATNRDSAQPRDNVGEINTENSRPLILPLSWNWWTETTSSPRISSRTSPPDATSDWLANLSKLPGQDQCGRSKVNLTDKIVGGRPAQLGAWPWMAILGYKFGPISWWGCDGTLISTRHVLTATHCALLFKPYIARLGDLNLDPNVQDGASPVDYEIAEILRHPQNHDYPSNNFHDVAILRLEKDVLFTDLIQPICLPFAPEINYNTWVDSWPYVAGWGKTIIDSLNASSALQEVQVQVWDNKKCNSTYEGYQYPDIDDRWICAGPEKGGEGPCKGDSGGPMMISVDNRFYQIGVVSWGDGCAEPGLPGVYARVSYYLEWIALNTE